MPPVAEDSAPKQLSWFARIRDRDHTRGDLLTSVLVLALPSIIASLAGAGAMQLGEMWITGKLGTSALAAVNSASQTFRQLTMLFLMGLQTATQMFIARMVGAAQREQAEHVAHEIARTLAHAGSTMTSAGQPGTRQEPPCEARTDRRPLFDSAAIADNVRASSSR